jgi:hypothetical protein
VIILQSTNLMIERHFFLFLNERTIINGLYTREWFLQNLVKLLNVNRKDQIFSMSTWWWWTTSYISWKDMIIYDCTNSYHSYMSQSMTFFFPRISNTEVHQYLILRQCIKAWPFYNRFDRSKWTSWDRIICNYMKILVDHLDKMKHKQPWSNVISNVTFYVNF